MQRAIAVFMTPAEAGEAIDELIDAGFATSEISILAKKDAVEHLVDDHREEEAIETAGAGAVGGTALGGLLGLIAGASALVVPGVGTAVAAGVWATVLGTTAAGAGIGAAYGGFVGALIGFGVAEEQTHVYVEGLESGGVLVSVRDKERMRLEKAESVMRASDGIGVDIVDEDDSD
jgi:hypothetical protein